MLTAIREKLRNLCRDERGNMFVLFGACSVPLLLIMGGVVDFARYARHKAELSNAVDAAALALGRSGEDYTEEQAKEFVQDYIASFALADGYFTLDEADYEVIKTDNGFRVTAVGSMRTIFLPLGDMARLGGGIAAMDLNIAAEVVHNSNRLELALVLDNTGSMNCAGTVGSCATNWSSPPSDSRIVALKNAATTLVNTLMNDELQDPDQIKIAVVPFEGMVNVASPGFSITNPPSWIDWSDEGRAKYNGVNFNTWNVDADSALERVGHKWLFNKLTADDSRVKWAGCVEMRAGAYELSDAAPDTTIPNSLFVPFFAPDEPDSSNDNGYSYSNNYLEDRVNTSENPTTAQRHMQKYSNNSEIRWRSGMDYDGSTSPYTLGPNRGCPKPILPLTDADGKATILTAINNMIAYWATGTYIPTGLIWGWHVLSPGVPYTEGLEPGDDYYEDTVKAMVLLTDGDNQVQPSDQTHNRSNYNGYGYVRQQVNGVDEYRLGTTGPTSEDALDTKTAALCESVKAEGNIRLYTITFGTLTEATRTMMRNCATLDEGERLYYHAPTSSDLDEIFVQIGEDLSRVHLSM